MTSSSLRPSQLATRVRCGCQRQPTLSAAINLRSMASMLMRQPEPYEKLPQLWKAQHPKSGFLLDPLCHPINAVLRLAGEHKPHVEAMATFIIMRHLGMCIDQSHDRIKAFRRNGHGAEAEGPTHGLYVKKWTKNA